MAVLVYNYKRETKRRDKITLFYDKNNCLFGEACKHGNIARGKVAQAANSNRSMCGHNFKVWCTI